MSNIVELPALAPETRANVLSYRSLVSLSRALSILFAFFTGLSVLWVVGAFVAIFFFADHIVVGSTGADISFPRVPPVPPGMVRFSAQPLATRLAGLLDIVMAMIPVALVCWHLRGLFTLYARGVVFARENALHLKRVGLWLVIYPFAKFAANMLFQLFGGTDKAWAQTLFLYSLILGIIVFVIAQVMEFGREIEEEKDSFV